MKDGEMPLLYMVLYKNIITLFCHPLCPSDSFQPPFTILFSSTNLNVEPVHDRGQVS